MRNKKRETTKERALEIFDEAPYTSIACIDEENKPYVVAVSAVREDMHVYFHCAKEGKKLDCITYIQVVCLNAVARHTTLSKQQTVSYASCIANGKAYVLNDLNEKRHALQILCQKFTPDHMECANTISDQGVENTGIVRIDIESYWGKEIND